MGRKRIKSVCKKVWRFSKWLLGWPFAIFGFIGIPDGLETWSKWIERAISWADSAMSDPRVQQLAESAVAIADFLNQPPIRVTLATIGVSILIWGWRPFWALRHWIVFFWRRALGEQTWIDRHNALLIIRSSDWANIRKPRQSISDLIGISVISGGSHYNPDGVRFNHFINMTLESFEENNPNYAREADGKKQYREDKLRLFLSRALDAEVIKQFGEVPDGSV